MAVKSAYQPIRSGPVIQPYRLIILETGEVREPPGFRFLCSLLTFCAEAAYCAKPPGAHDDVVNAVAGVIGAIASGVGSFNFEFWHDDRTWNGGAPSSDELLWFLKG